MRAIRVHRTGGPEVLQYETVPDPSPGPEQVLVRVAAVGVNPVDTYIRSGVYARMPELPYIPGSDAAGVVAAVGPGAGAVAPGDRVWVSGTAGALLTGACAELLVADRRQVHPLPARVSFAQGAALGVPCGTAYRALFQKARAVPGETVLVHGASGAVGIAAVQIGAAHGLRVIGTAGSERGRALVRESGAQAVLDHATPGYLDQLAGLTAGRGPDVILEMLANVNLARDLEVVARHGRVVVIGNRGTIEINPRLTMLKDVTVQGLVLWNAGEAELASIAAALGAGLAHGWLRPVVREELPLREAARAHQRVLEPGAYGKIVLIP